MYTETRRLVRFWICRRNNNDLSHAHIQVYSLSIQAGRKKNEKGARFSQRQESQTISAYANTSLATRREAILLGIDYRFSFVLKDSAPMQVSAGCAKLTVIPFLFVCVGYLLVDRCALLA